MVDCIVHRVSALPKPAKMSSYVNFLNLLNSQIKINSEMKNLSELTLD